MILLNLRMTYVPEYQSILLFNNMAIEFLKETKMCVLNGRFNPALDGQSSVSTKRSAV